MSNETEHAPGPWCVYHDLECGFWIETMNGYRVMPTEANVRLVAAAPDLLAACSDALANLMWDGVPHLTAGEMQHRTNLAIYALRAALAKAEGK